jgi:hypothetical protein
LQFRCVSKYIEQESPAYQLGQNVADSDSLDFKALQHRAHGLVKSLAGAPDGRVSQLLTGRRLLTQLLTGRRRLTQLLMEGRRQLSQLLTGQRLLTQLLMGGRRRLTQLLMEGAAVADTAADGC